MPDPDSTQDHSPSEHTYGTDGGRVEGGFEIPDDAPEPPAGVDNPYLFDSNMDAPPRYDCLLCDEWYFEPNQLREHVEMTHNLRDLYTACRPINVPRVAWFASGNVPVTAYTREAALYLKRALNIEGEPPALVERHREGECPACGEDEPARSMHPATLAREHDEHTPWEMYQELREAVPEPYERSPVFDAAGYEGPAATVNCLQPDDRVRLFLRGWQQSLGTPRGQTREQISDDQEWEATGFVTSVEDSRVTGGPELWEDDSIHREVFVRAETSLFDEPITLSLQPRSGGDVAVSFRPTVTQGQASQRHGHGGPGQTQSRLEDEEAIIRTPWHERDTLRRSS